MTIVVQQNTVEMEQSKTLHEMKKNVMMEIT